MWNGFFWARSSALVVGGVISVLAAGVGGLAPAEAREPQPRSERVSYADLNLRTSAGRAKLEARIERASRRVCSVEGSLIPMARRLERRCEAASREAARVQMRQAVQYALADSRS